MSLKPELFQESLLIEERLIKRGLLFIPGLYVVLILSGILIMAIGFSILYILENALSVFLTAFSFQIALAVGAGMIVGIFGVFKGLYRAIWKKAHFEVAVEITKDNEPQLFSVIEQLCLEMNCKVPDVILLHAGPDFFVMDGRLKVINGEVSGTILCLSMPMLSFLSMNELRAVLAHEFAHFTGWDVEYTKKIVPVYTGVLATVHHLDRGGGHSVHDYGPLMSIPNFLPLAMLKIYINLFHKMNMSLSRAREKRADIISVMMCGTHSFTEAIQKVVSIGKVFTAVSVQDLTGEYKNGRGFINYYQIFRDHVEQFEGHIQQQLEFEMNRLPVKQDSHPTLRERLGSVPFVEEKYADTQPAYGLLNRNMKYEQELSDAYSKILNCENTVF